MAEQDMRQAGVPPANGPRQRYAPPRWLKITVLVTMITLVTGAVASAAALAGLFWYYGRHLDSLDEEALLNYRPAQVTRVLDRNGVLIGEIFTERRTFVAYNAIPADVENAFLAAEDADFYRHEGMDYIGMVRALVANVRAGKMRQGASTITQQVVKNFLLSPERTLERKVQELVLSRRIEQVLDKSKILELYLNDIYLGHGRYGIQEASLFYFGKGIEEIDLGQAALLATLPKAPGTATPYKNYEKAKARQVYVLQQMQENGFASPEEVARFIDLPLDIVDRDADADADTEIDPGRAAKVTPGAEEFVDVAKAELIERFGADKLGELGATVTMTVDVELQRKARAGLLDSLIEMDERRQYGHGVKPAKPKNKERAIKRGAGPHAAGQTYPVIIGERGPELPAALLDRGFPGVIGESLHVFVQVPSGSRYDEADKTTLEQFPAGGITMAHVLTLQAPAELGLPAGWALAEIGSGPEAAAIVTDVDSGEVLAMVGGYRYGRGDFNRALAAKRQPGSSFKPFIYGAALRSGSFTAASLIEDSPEIYQKWRPTNYERDVYRGDIRMRVALTQSVNTVAIKLLDATGIDQAVEFASVCGIESHLEPNLSLALGTSEVTPFELMRAYLTLARGGSRIEPILIRSIEVPGEERWEPTREASQVLDGGLVFVLTSLMRSVVEDGTGQRAKQLGIPVAGKTGTAAESKDAWFAGFTQDYVAIAWVGFDTPKPMTGESGGKAALPIWLAAMTAMKDRPNPVGDPSIAPTFSPFSPPPSVAVRTIDKATGLLAPPFVIGPDGLEQPPDPATIMDEYFLTGSEPTLVASAQVQPTADILLDLYGDDPADAELEGTVPTPEPDAIEPPPSEPMPSEPSEPTPSEPTPSEPSEPSEPDSGYDELPSIAPG